MQGIFDSSGMMYFYTQQQPLHIAGTMTVEYNTFPYLTLIIPPNAEQFNITCSTHVTNNVDVMMWASCMA